MAREQRLIAARACGVIWMRGSALRSAGNAKKVRAASNTASMLAGDAVVGEIEKADLLARVADGPGGLAPCRGTAIDERAEIDHGDGAMRHDAPKSWAPPPG